MVWKRSIAVDTIYLDRVAGHEVARVGDGVGLLAMRVSHGYVLYQRKPTNDPSKAAIKIVISPTLGIYIIFK